MNGMTQEQTIRQMVAARAWWADRLARGDVLNAQQVQEHIDAIDQSIERLKRNPR